MNNTLTTIIEKAISGGYKNGYTVNGSIYRDDHLYNKDTQDLIGKEYIACDPLFWQSLGKACGWKRNDTDDSNRSGCIYMALQFHRINLTTSFEEAVAWLGKVVEG